MARKHASILVSIWEDPDFIALPSLHQVVYFAVLSSRDLSWCGVNPYLPQRFKAMSADMTERRFTGAVEALDDARFLVLDRDTAEVAARTFVRHDDILNVPNVSKAMGRALQLVRSPRIRTSVISELARVHRERPDARGWASFAAAYPDLFSEVCGIPSLKGSRNPSANPSAKGS